VKRTTLDPTIVLGGERARGRDRARGREEERKEGRGKREKRREKGNTGTTPHPSHPPPSTPAAASRCICSQKRTSLPARAQLYRLPTSQSLSLFLFTYIHNLQYTSCCTYMLLLHREVTYHHLTRYAVRDQHRDSDGESRRRLSTPGPSARGTRDSGPADSSASRTRTCAAAAPCRAVSAMKRS
jgi:hypothetical protein